MSENFYDGAWRPVIDLSDTALMRLTERGFEFGTDKTGHLVARWPLEPAQPALPLAGVALEYWREEARLNSSALDRLRRICAERGADYDKTLAGLRDG